MPGEAITLEVMSALKHVLYVEDNEGDIHLVKSALAERRVQVDLHVVPNAVQAFSFMARQGAFAQAPPVDLVILDINLPIINGVKALSIIKTSPEWRNIPVIVLTSSERSDDRNLCVRMGVIGYHVKPKLWDEYLHLADTFKEAISTGCVSVDKRSQASGASPAIPDAPDAKNGDRAKSV